MVVRKAPSVTTTTISTIIVSPHRIAEDWDADDEATMSSDGYPTPRPLSLAIPVSVGGAHGPYCPRRPNLREILANTAPSPWNLTAFMAYLSQNHCLETLEFTMDAGRYRSHYQKMMARSTGGTPPLQDREYVQALWLRLVDAYIRSNGSREVNLPSDVRDPILRLQPSTLPPSPETLDRAVAKIYELMEESVLLPFLNSMYPQTARSVASASSLPYHTSEESIGSRSTREPRRRGRAHRESPPPLSAVEPYSPSYIAASPTNRKSAPSALLAQNRFSARPQQSTSSPTVPYSRSTDPGAAGGCSEAQFPVTHAGMTDDSGSTGSPTTDDPMTPPTSPPIGDISPKRDSGMWKKLTRFSGMKPSKKRNQNGVDER